MDCSLPGSSVYGIFQKRVLEWVPLPSPGNLPNPGIEPGSPALQTDAFTVWATREALFSYSRGNYFFFVYVYGIILGNIQASSSLMAFSLIYHHPPIQHSLVYPCNKQLCNIRTYINLLWQAGPVRLKETNHHLKVANLWVSQTSMPKFLNPGPETPFDFVYSFCQRLSQVCWNCQLLLSVIWFFYIFLYKNDLLYI